MTLQERIDAELIRISNEKEGRERSGLFGASSFGKCIRAQVFNRLNVTKSEPFDIKTLHMFNAGHIVHDYIQRYFDNAQCEVLRKDEHFIGFADIVLEDIVYDIKSVNPSYFFFGWKDKKKVEYNVPEINNIIKDKKKSNILQVTHYAIELNKPRIGLVFFSRDLSYGIRAHEWTDNTDRWADDVRKEKKTLVEAWGKHKETGELPPACPRLYDGKECQYCGWMSYCKTVK